MKESKVILFLAIFLCATTAFAQKKGKKPPKPPASSPTKEAAKPKEEPAVPPDVSKMAENIGFLDLEGTRDGRAFAGKLQEELQKNLKVPILPKDPLPTLAEAAKCKPKDTNCLGYVAAYIGSRYLLYGETKSQGGKLTIELHLYDAKTPKEITEIKSTAESASDTAAAVTISNQLLNAVPELRKPPPEPPKPKVKKDLVSDDSLIKKPWFWAVVGGGLAAGAGGGFFATTRAPAATDSDLGTFPVER